MDLWSNYIVYLLMITTLVMMVIIIVSPPAARSSRKLHCKEFSSLFTYTQVRVYVVLVFSTAVVVVVGRVVVVST